VHGSTIVQAIKRNKFMRTPARKRVSRSSWVVVAAVALMVGSSPSARTQPSGCAGAISVYALNFYSIGVLARGSNRSGNVLGIGAPSEGDFPALPGTVLRAMDLHHHAGRDLGQPPGAADNFNPWSS